MLLPERKTTRLSHWDYALPGMYYVTIVTQGRAHRFGHVENSRMITNDNGRIVQMCWDELRSHYDYMWLDKFVVMPNHIHGIIGITDVGAGLRPALAYASTSRGTLHDRVHDSSIVRGHRTGHRPVPTVRHGLSEIVRAFKSYSSRRINVLNDEVGGKIWQRSFYDHIIRDENDLDRIRKYIRSNPTNWITDTLR